MVIRAGKSVTPLGDDTLVASIREYMDADEAAKASNNKKNRIKTALGKLLVDFQNENGGAEIIVDGKKVSYGASESMAVTPDVWYKEFKEGRLTERQFLDAISVSITSAREAAGADVVLTLQRSVKGSNADVRMAKLTKEEAASVTLPESASYAVIVSDAKTPLSRKRIAKGRVIKTG